MDKPSPHIAIAILNYNGRALLEQYLPSVLATTYANKSVWVIDNNSTDDSIAFLKRKYPNVGLIKNEANYGFAEGYNKGLKDIQADYFVLLNSDVEVSPGFMQPVVQAMEANATIAFAQPKMRWLRKLELFEYAGAAGGLIDKLGYPFCRGRIFESIETDLGQYNDSPFVFWASGACLFTRAKVFWELGGFYPFFFMHNEEIDLCWRAQNKGYKIMACGNSSVMHLGGASLQKENPRKTFFNFRNNLVMLARNMPITRLLWVLPVRWVLDGIAAVRFLVKGESGAAISVIKAWMAFAGWLLQNDKEKWPGIRGFKQLDGVSFESIVFKHFLGTKK